MMCDGSSLSDTSGGIRNPVATGQDREQQEDLGQAPRPVDLSIRTSRYARGDCDQADDERGPERRRQAHTEYHDAPRF